jgi:hypothetical protein
MLLGRTNPELHNKLTEWNRTHLNARQSTLKRHVTFLDLMIAVLISKIVFITACSKIHGLVLRTVNFKQKKKTFSSSGCPDQNLMWCRQFGLLGFCRVVCWRCKMFRQTLQLPSSGQVYGEGKGLGVESEWLVIGASSVAVRVPADKRKAG